MVVTGSQEKQTSPSGSVGKDNSHMYRSNQSQHPGGPQYSYSTGNIPPLNTSLSYEPRSYTETDSLLPNEHYEGSKLSGNWRGNDPEGSGTQDVPAESVCSMLLQILVPFLLAGIGTVSAGMLLEVVQVRSAKRGKPQKRFRFHIISKGEYSI